jgi:serine/threonine protein phosphatase PrpC
MNIRQYINLDMEEVTPLNTCGPGQVVVFSTRAPGKASSNEDSALTYCLDNDTCVLVVADGMGGALCGDQASRIAVQSLEKAVTASDAETLRETVLSGIDEANRNIESLGVGAGSTLVVGEILNNKLRAYHVGDSELLVVGQRGKLKFHTVSHSPVAYAVEAGLINETQAMIHEQRHVIFNALGNREMRVDMGPGIKLSRFDTVLLASDGVFDNLYVQEIVEIIRKGRLDFVARRLLDICRERMTTRVINQPCKPDDLTFILFRRSI